MSRARSALWGPWGSNPPGLPDSLETFVALKSKWLVSIQAMLMRCQSLGLVLEDHATRMWRSLSRRGFRKREPLDDELESEMPRLLPKAITMLAERNQAAPADLVRGIEMSPMDIAQLAMLPVETFQEPRDPKIIPFPLDNA